MPVPESRLNSSNLFPDIKIDNKFLLDIWESYKVGTEYLDNEEFYIDYPVKQYERWDQISEKVYETRELWWVLILTNVVEDPFVLYRDSILPDSLDTIKILKPSKVIELVDLIRNNRLANDIIFKNNIRADKE
jgi:hypothetical protein